MNVFERHLVDELHEISNNLKSINRSLAVLFSEEKNEDNKDGGDTESDNTV